MKIITRFSLILHFAFLFVLFIVKALYDFYEQISLPVRGFIYIEVKLENLVTGYYWENGLTSSTFQQG